MGLDIEYHVTLVVGLLLLHKDMVPLLHNHLATAPGSPSEIYTCFSISPFKEGRVSTYKACSVLFLLLHMKTSAVTY